MTAKMMSINIENYVRRLKDIDFMQPLYEAVVNSLDAQASNISIQVKSQEVLDKDSGKKLQLINGFEITDNGEGFTEKNIDSFFEMLSEKKDEGKLGSGRFIWLKVFNDITIKSKLKDKTIKINFCKSYKDITCDEIIERNDKQETTIYFSNINEAYINKRPINNVHYIRTQIEDTLLAKLLLLKKTGKKFLITIDDLVTIDNKSLPELREETFKVKSNNYDTEEEFKLYYRVKRAEDGKVSNYYVAHGRLVKPFTSEVKIDKLPDNSSSTMLLTSSYFDKHIKDDRKSFSIDVINESEESPVTLLNINCNLKQKVDNILLKELPEIKETNNQNIEDAIREEPHLSKYIQESAHNSSIANKQDLLKSAKKQYEKDRERIRSDFKKILENKKLKADEYQQIINEFNEFQVYELGRYIAYRQQIIEHLKQLNERNENSEELLHTLFMQMKTCEDNSQYHYKQNMWLIDDKFMSYLYIASDKTFNQINKAINGERIPKSQNGSDRPDLFVYFSDDENEKNVDCLVVELKAIGASDEEKNKSITELSNNVTTIRENMPNIRNIYSFIISKIDEQFLKTIKGQDYKPFISKNDTHFYYKYYEFNKHHSYVLSTDTICEEAFARNKVFMDLLRNSTKADNDKLKNLA